MQDTHPGPRKHKMSTQSVLGLAQREDPGGHLADRRLSRRVGKDGVAGLGHPAPFHLAVPKAGTWVGAGEDMGLLFPTFPPLLFPGHSPEKGPRWVSQGPGGDGGGRVASRPGSQTLSMRKLRPGEGKGLLHGVSWFSIQGTSSLTPRENLASDTRFCRCTSQKEAGTAAPQPHGTVWILPARLPGHLPHLATVWHGEAIATRS